MAEFKLVATTQPDAASNTSLSSEFSVPVEFSQFAVEIPTTANWCVTATGGIGVLGAGAAAGTFRAIFYSSNPATATTGGVQWISGNNTGNSLLICEALAFVPRFAKLQFTNTATASTDFKIYARKLD